MKLAVISQSARIYAHFAHQAGYQVCAVDGFADTDLFASAAEVLHWPPIVNGWKQTDLDVLINTLDGWQADTLVLGSGFEHDPAAYAMLYDRYPVAGNPPAWMTAVKQPDWLAQACRQAGVMTPEVSETAPTPTSNQRWLIKQRGGCGGRHIRDWQPGVTSDANSYYQAWQQGVSVGGLCIGNGNDCRLIGVHRLHQHGYAYAGATSWHDQALTQAMHTLLAKLYAHMPLLGLFSLDARWHQGQLYLLEVNPRLSASMRIYAELPLMQAHLSACQGQPLEYMVVPNRVASHRIVYTRQAMPVSALDMPIWLEDRPSGAKVEAGAPLCSVYACAEVEDVLQQQLRYQFAYLKEQWGSYVSEYIECND